MKLKTEAQMLIEFMEGLNEASGAAGALIHSHQDMRWYFVRQIIEEMKGTIEKIVISPITAPKVTKYEKKYS